MSKEQTTDLMKFLKAFSEDRKKIALKLRDFVWDLYPQTNEFPALHSTTVTANA